MSVNIMFVGDIVNTTKSETFIHSDLVKIIKKQNFAVCNFEAPINENSKKIKKAGPNILQKKETIQILNKSGFNLLLLANNHIYDYGIEGLKNTLKEAKKSKLDIVGAGVCFEDAYKPIIKKINGLNIGIINACEAQFGVLDGHNLNQVSGYAWINHPLIDTSIINLKNKVDKIIVCVHAGLENYSIPLSQWKARYKNLCDLGADCIIGSHPHVPQGYEVYKNKPIFYSLGNFYFDTESFSNSMDHSYSVILKITKNDIRFELIFHYKKDGIVRIIEEKDFPIKIQELNEKLYNDNEIVKMYLNAYHNITKKYFASIYNYYLSNDSFLQLLKKTVLKFVCSKSFKLKRELLLQHLLRNESYRWVTITAIELLKRNKK